MKSKTLLFIFASFCIMVTLAKAIELSVEETELGYASSCASCSNGNCDCDGNGCPETFTAGNSQSAGFNSAQAPGGAIISTLAFVSDIPVDFMALDNQNFNNWANGQPYTTIGDYSAIDATCANFTGGRVLSSGFYTVIQCHNATETCTASYYWNYVPILDIPPPSAASSYEPILATLFLALTALAILITHY